MLLYFHNIKHEHVFVCDIEYDKNNILQFAAMVFKLVDKKNSIYQLAYNMNFYVKTSYIHHYTIKYTGLTPKFLNQHGIHKEAFINVINNFLNELNPETTLFVSHGSKNDRLILKTFGIQPLPSHSYCTFKNAKRILKRETDLTLNDIAIEAGFQLNHKHDAHFDALTTVVIFSFLQKLDSKIK
jgi:DNA polymerase III epsilon subunit-like protein